MSTNSNNTLSLQEAALLALQCMDLTSLNDDDTSEKIEELCQQAHQKGIGHVAAICIYSDWIKTAKKHLSKDVKIATVVNFPHGNAVVSQAVLETERAIELGADEVDVVFPYKALKEDGNEQVGYDLVKACKEVCSNSKSYAVLLKVILETGELVSDALIDKASQIAIRAGADFIKTSTGKVKVNATLESAEIMLKCIQSSNQPVGFKAAGGVRTVADAREYIQLAQKIMGPDWVTPANFRFGASGLLRNVLGVLSAEDGGQQAVANNSNSTEY